MTELKHSIEILNFAIKEEEKAAQFYTELAGKMEKPWMKEVFEEFAKEELGHKKKLLGIKNGRIFEADEEKIIDLKIAEYVTQSEPSPDMTYQDALIIAMNAEKNAFKLYSDLAELVTDEGAKKTLLGLAQEEAKHKLRFEIEYDDRVLTEN